MMMIAAAFGRALEKPQRAVGQQVAAVRVRTAAAFKHPRLKDGKFLAIILKLFRLLHRLSNFKSSI